MMTEDLVVDDSRDVLFLAPDGKAPFAMVRPSKCKCILLVNLINSFGEMGGFQKILDRINDHENPIPFGTICSEISL